jgi:hypothetical protein
MWRLWKEMELNALERCLLIGYLCAVSSAVLVAPEQPNQLLHKAGCFVDIVPAIARLIEISWFPGKTIAWAASSIALSPLLLIFSISRLRVFSQSKVQEIEIRRVRNALLIVFAVVLPWPLMSWYHPDMTRGGALISMMGKSEIVLAIQGAAISLVFFVIAFLALVFTLKARSGPRGRIRGLPQ